MTGPATAAGPVTVAELSAQANAQLFDDLADALGRDAPVLDIGVGAGGFAAELVRRGVPVRGLDLADLRSAAPNLPFVAADATRLPVRSASCGGVHLARVLYHIEDWRRALDEIARVLVPGGALCVALGWPRYQGRLRELSDAVYAEAERRGLRRCAVAADLDGWDELDAELGRRGLRPQRRITATGSVQLTARDVLADVASVRDRWKPGQDLTALPAVAASVLADSGQDLDAAESVERTVRYQVYRLRSA